MTQNSKKFTLMSTAIMGTNFGPREWRAMDSLKSSGTKKMSPEQFGEFLGTYELSRKQFCEIFGVGESTVSGWLNGKGIPETMEHALSTALEFDIYIEQLHQFAEELDAAQFDPRVVKDGETYSIIGFTFEGNVGQEVGKNGRQPVGSVIARGIPDLSTALELASAQSLLRTLKIARSEIGRKKPHKQYFGYNYGEEIVAEIDAQINSRSISTEKEE